jgi:hypothetical protein
MITKMTASAVEYKVRFTLVNAPDVKVSSQVSIRPHEAELTYGKGRDGAPEFRRCRLAGRRVLKTGRVTGYERYQRFGSGLAPEWLHDLIREHTPLDLHVAERTVAAESRYGLRREVTPDAPAGDEAADADSRPDLPLDDDAHDRRPVDAGLPGRTPQAQDGDLTGPLDQ